MLDKFKQLMEVKRQAERIKRELDSSTIEINEVRGIKIIVNGAQRFQAIEIDNEFLGPESKKRLETELLRGINLAVSKSQALAAQKMKDITGLNIPGL